MSGDSRLIMLPGCPANAANIAALVVHYVTFGEMPATDPMGRPLFAYGDLIHNKCERRPHFEFGEFALAWGDEGAQKGWCLYKLGCKGPETMGNCPTVRYGGGVSWNIKAGHGCIGCFAPDFWDSYGPAYDRLPPPIPFFPNITVDQVGVAAVAGIGAVALVHGTGMATRSTYRARKVRRQAAQAAGGMVAVEEPAESAEVREPAGPVAETSKPAESAEPVTVADDPAEAAVPVAILEPAADARETVEAPRSAEPADAPADPEVR